MPKEALNCPACGSRNRVAWQFCARCGESLENATVVAAPAVVSDDSPSPLRPVAAFVTGAVAFALVLHWAWQASARARASTGPAPKLFGVESPVRPPSPAGPPPPGEQEYADGRRLMHAGDLRGAIAAFEKAVTAQPDNPDFQNAYGIALWRDGRTDAAIAAHAQAAGLDSRLRPQYARTLDVAGRSEDAAREYAAILAANPDADGVREDYGRLLFRTGDYARAAPLLEKTAAARPDDPVLMQELAYSLDRTGDRDRATAAYREVLARAPEAAIARSLLADSLFQQGKREEAVDVVRQGLDRTPNAPLLHRQMGSLLERAGQREQAAAAYRQYARLAPNAADVGDIVARAGRLAPERSAQ